MDKKTLSIVSYLTFVGWLIAYFSYKDKADKSSLEKFHLKQSFGLGIVLSVGYMLVMTVLNMFLPAGIVRIIDFASILLLVLMILGIITAMNEQEKELPIVGGLFKDKFDFIQ